MHNSVDIDTAILCNLFVITIPARIQQHSIVFVLFRIQHIVALLTKFDAHKLGPTVILEIQKWHLDLGNFKNYSLENVHTMSVVGCS